LGQALRPPRQIADPFYNVIVLQLIRLRLDLSNPYSEVAITTVADLPALPKAVSSCQVLEKSLHCRSVANCLLMRRRGYSLP